MKIGFDWRRGHSCLFGLRDAYFEGLGRLLFQLMTGFFKHVLRFLLTLLPNAVFLAGVLLLVVESSTLRSATRDLRDGSKKC